MINLLLVLGNFYDIAPTRYLCRKEYICFGWDCACFDSYGSSRKSLEIVMNNKKGMTCRTVYILQAWCIDYICIHCHSMVFLHFGMYCTVSSLMVVIYIVANNPYMQRKHCGDFWINFHAENNKVHAMPQNYNQSP